MYTYLIQYDVYYYRDWEHQRRVLNLERKIESLEDIEFIERCLNSKIGGKKVRVNSFSRLKKCKDKMIYSLDEEW